MTDGESPAIAASKKALEEMYSCLEKGQSFRLEAGAGAGKTYSLVKALHFLIEKLEKRFPQQNQQIACITYTNIAKEEIESRIDRSPLVFCDTNHAFCWSLISGFQKQLREEIEIIPEWQQKLEDAGGIGNRIVEYNLGHRSVRETSISLHHEDVIPLSIRLMTNGKFRRMMAQRFPIILIDEYQDTDANWVEALKLHFLGQDNSPLFGFFGDHWQKIYGNGCGKLEHSAIKEIGKEANFRSVGEIVDCLNRMRPELPQCVQDPKDKGQVRVFHTNDWKGKRQGGSHWAGDLPSEVGHEILERVKRSLAGDGWDLAPSATKILMLTHRLLASEQGYQTLPSVFRFTESFTKKENRQIAYLVDVLEPACDAFAEQRFGDMFEAVGGKVPLLRNSTDKKKWSDSMSRLLKLRESGSVGQLLDHLRSTNLPRLPDAIIERERELQSFDKSSGAEMPRVLVELEKLREVKYSEIRALRSYLAGYSPFETKHGVKGAEFENVLVVIGRGWNKYNFGTMLELAGCSRIPTDKEETFLRNRNLFYVACSRPKRRLALLFTQQLSQGALETLEAWFGTSVIESLA